MMRGMSMAILFLVLVTVSPAALAADLDKKLVEKTILENWGDAASSAKKQMVEKDFTCDGTSDVIIGRINGDKYDLLVMTEDGGDFYAENLAIPLTGATTQIGLCYQAGDATPSLGVEAWTKEETEEVFGSEICNRPIMVSGGECDPLYYFWAPKNADSKLAPYRQ